jgi:hypothetical protein
MVLTEDRRYTDVESSTDRILFLVLTSAFLCNGHHLIDACLILVHPANILVYHHVDLTIQWWVSRDTRELVSLSDKVLLLVRC